MKAIVCGGRSYRGPAHVCATLDEINPHEIVCGGGVGADAYAIYWARDRECIHHVYPAKWKVHGNKAGPIRNQEMLDSSKPDLVIAFPGGRGTADMVRRAEKAGVEVRVVEEEP
jgi:predicted Rossmann-fold nucleotide-binding protein